MSIRWNWQKLKPKIQQELLAGRYRLSALKEYRFEKEKRWVWSALDALVLKALSQILEPLVRSEVTNCYHLKGSGGGKKAVRDVKNAIVENKFCLRSDVKSFYASIDHQKLFEQLKNYIKDIRVLDLLCQYMNFTVEFGGIYKENQRGICLGCPISPLIGALFLKPLDNAMAKLDIFYLRYMDDWVILAKTRWKLKRAIKKMNEILDDLKLEKHPEKTQINPIKRGFVFLGYQFFPDSLQVCNKTLECAFSKIARLYEQGASKERIGNYWKNFWRWVRGGLGDILDEKQKKSTWILILETMKPQGDPNLGLPAWDPWR